MGKGDELNGGRMGKVSAGVAITGAVTTRILLRTSQAIHLVSTSSTRIRPYLPGEETDENTYHLPGLLGLMLPAKGVSNLLVRTNGGPFDACCCAKQAMMKRSLQLNVSTCMSIAESAIKCMSCIVHPFSEDLANSQAKNSGCHGDFGMCAKSETSHGEHE